jgi:hypothetical protein
MSRALKDKKSTMEDFELRFESAVAEAGRRKARRVLSVSKEA